MATVGWSTELPPLFHLRPSPPRIVCMVLVLLCWRSAWAGCGDDPMVPYRDVARSTGVALDNVLLYLKANDADALRDLLDRYGTYIACLDLGMANAEHKIMKKGEDAAKKAIRELQKAITDIADAAAKIKAIADREKAEIVRIGGHPGGKRGYPYKSVPSTGYRYVAESGFGKRNHGDKKVATTVDYRHIMGSRKRDYGGITSTSIGKRGDSMPIIGSGKRSAPPKQDNRQIIGSGKRSKPRKQSSRPILGSGKRSEAQKQSNRPIIGTGKRYEARKQDNKPIIGSRKRDYAYLTGSGIGKRGNNQYPYHYYAIGSLNQADGDAIRSDHQNQGYRYVSGTGKQDNRPIIGSRKRDYADITGSGIGKRGDNPYHFYATATEKRGDYPYHFYATATGKRGDYDHIMGGKRDNGLIMGSSVGKRGIDNLPPHYRVISSSGKRSDERSIRSESQKQDNRPIIGSRKRYYVDIRGPGMGKRRHPPHYYIGGSTMLGHTMGSGIGKRGDSRGIIGTGKRGDGDITEYGDMMGSGFGKRGHPPHYYTGGSTGTGKRGDNMPIIGTGKRDNDHVDYGDMIGSGMGKRGHPPH